MAVHCWTLTLHTGAPDFLPASVRAHARPFIVFSARTSSRVPKRKSTARTPSGNKIPSPLHAVLPWEKQLRGRTLIVGDVHGCFDELQELLKACNFRRQKDNLVFVGDIVNKGPKSAEVVNFALEVGAYAVRGNHDDGALHAIRVPTSRYRNDKTTGWLDELGPAQVSYLNSLPFSLRLEGRGVVVVHAGLKPGRSLLSQRLNDLYSLRDCRPAGSHQAKVPWASIWRGPGHVFFGHDAVRGLQLHAAATGLDTGCCYGKQLTACILPALSPSAEPEDQAAASLAAALEDPDAASSANAEVFAQARQATRAMRGLLAGRQGTAGGKDSRGKGEGAREQQQPQQQRLKHKGRSAAAQDRGAVTLAHLKAQLVSVPARVVYCMPKGKEAARQAKTRTDRLLVEGGA